MANGLMLTLTALALIAMAAAPAPAADAPTDCDRLAGSPTDPQRVAEGVGLFGIEIDAALAACAKAVAANPKEPRLLYELGRAQESAAYGVTGAGAAPAMATYRRAAEMGYAAAQAEAQTYAWWDFLSGDAPGPEEAVRLFKLAAKADPAEARQIRRRDFVNAAFQRRLSQAALGFLQGLADRGDPDALYALGHHADQSPEAKPPAIELWTKAAAAGSAGAAEALARKYSGIRGGAPLDFDRAKAYNRQAAEGDDPSARGSAAQLYELGFAGLKPDPALAAKLFKRSSDEGDKWARFDYAECLETGKGGVTPDAAAAADLYKRAAEQGHEDAALAYVRIVSGGAPGFPADNDRAQAFLRRAARWSEKAKTKLKELTGGG